MAVTLNASTSTGLVQSADTSGVIQLQSNGTTALTVNTNEGIQILNCLGVGNATPSTSGAGITFPATQSASSDANTLDDYEEGTWTGTIKGLTTDPTTPVTATGSYTKIGRQVFARITYSNITTTGASGAFYVSGLPFTTGDSEATGNVMTYSLATFAGSNLCPYVTGTSVFLYYMSSNGVWDAATHNAGANRYLIVSVTYQV